MTLQQLDASINKNKRLLIGGLLIQFILIITFSLLKTTDPALLINIFSFILISQCVVLNLVKTKRLTIFFFTLLPVTLALLSWYLLSPSFPQTLLIGALALFAITLISLNVHKFSFFLVSLDESALQNLFLHFRNQYALQYPTIKSAFICSFNAEKRFYFFKFDDAFEGIHMLEETENLRYKIERHNDWVNLPKTSIDLTLPMTLSAHERMAIMKDTNA